MPSLARRFASFADSWFSRMWEAGGFWLWNLGLANVEMVGGVGRDGWESQPPGKGSISCVRPVTSVHLSDSAMV